ncbi:MAG: Phthioceranic/hydroxyphthioceranic acid synthase [Firmicutes bacterium ADurb.Bin419]|nr:MAG: Phthioceranic/hydroxyphthioceranic acid synthase [Firmicutes bacterium ADurb.Bin419]
MGNVFSEGRAADKPCVIGSVKTNIGHTEAAAGVAGLIKTSLCLKKKAIPPHLHFIEANPKIDFKKLSLRLPLKTEEWPSHEGIALAGVNSFGFGGTNSHAILAEAPQLNKKYNPGDGKPVLIPISARSKDALVEAAKLYKDMLDANALECGFYDLGYSMTLRRDHHDYRLGIVAKDFKDLSDKLEAFIEEENVSGVVSGNKNPNNKEIVFVFTGMGPQWWAMGRQLIETEPVFKGMIEKCDRELMKYTGWSLMQELLADEASSNMSKTRVSQPANFAVQVALAAMWRSWGIKPDVIVGHSTGEVAALYEAGVYSFEDAVKIIYYRSSLQQKLAGMGSMLAVGVSEEAAKELLMPYNGKVDIGAVNSLNGVTLSGDTECLQIIANKLTEEGTFNKFLQVEIPFHSPCMEHIKDEILEGLKDIKPMKATTKLYSTVTGKIAQGLEMDAGYWWNNVRNSVLFAPAANEIVKEGYSLLVEVGPHPVLATSINEILKHNKVEGMVIPSLKRKEDERRIMLESLGKMYIYGCKIDWRKFYPEDGCYVKLPAYPWQHERFWIESEEGSAKRLGVYGHPLLGRRVSIPEPCWESELKKELIPFLEDHIIQGNMLYPAAGYLEMGLAAANNAFGEGFYTLKDIEFSKALFINDDKTTKVQILLNRENSTFKIFSAPGDKSSGPASYGKLYQTQKKDINKNKGTQFFSSRIKSDEFLEFSKEECYRRFVEMGFQYGSSFQGIDRIWVGHGETIGKIVLPEELKGTEEVYKIHPATIDACFQSIIALNFIKEDSQEEIRLPVKVEQFAIYSRPTNEMWVQSVTTMEDEITSKGDIFLYSNDGKLIAEIIGFTVQNMNSVRSDLPLKTLDSWLYKLEWEEKSREIKENNTYDNGSWIILADTKGVGEKLAHLLSQKGEECLLVYPDKFYSFDAENNKGYINPVSSSDFREILTQYNSAKTLKGIIHLWNLEAENTENLNIQLLDEAKKLGAFSVIKMIQGLAESNKKCSIWIVTQGVQKLEGDNFIPSIAQAPVWGMSRVIANQEHTGIWGGIADIDVEDVESCLNELVEDITGTDGEDQLVYRKGKRYIARVNNIKGLNEPLTPTFRKNAGYLVTGAFGSLGQLTVRWMAQKGARNLIFLGRTNIPPRSEWRNIDLDSDVGARIEFIREIEDMGVNIHIASVDVANEKQLGTFLEEYRNEGRPEIKGILSIAGTVKDQMLTKMEEDTFDSVFKPKVMGTWLLHKQFEKEELDFFIIYSSIAALVTSSGQANYASANSFLDMLASYRRDKGLPAISIGWGPWMVGMVKDLNLVELYQRKGMNPIMPKAGMQVLERLFAQNIPYAAVVEAEWDKVIDSGPRAKPPYINHLRNLNEQGSDNVASDEDIRAIFMNNYSKAEPEAKKEIVLENMFDLVCKVMHLKRTSIDSGSSLNALGIDSMMAIELKNRIELNLGVNIPIVEILNNSSLGALAGSIMAQLDELLTPASMDELIASTDKETVDDLLTKIDTLSEEEVLKMLKD